MNRNCDRNPLRRQSTRLRRFAHCEQLEARNLLTADIVGGGSFLTIQEAVDNAAPGDVIEITPGIYAESVDLSRMGIAIGGGPGDLALRGIADGVAIEPPSGRAMFNDDPFGGDLSISRIGFTSADNTGLDLSEYAGNLKIVNSKFNGNNENGIEVDQATGRIAIIDSEILDLGNKGIRLEEVENVLIQGVTIDGGGGAGKDGIFGRDVSDIVIRGNSIQSIGSVPADDGIDLKDTSGTVYIHGNTIRNAGDDGIQVENNENVQAKIAIIGNKIADSVVGGGIEVRLNDDAVASATILGNKLASLEDHNIDLLARDQAKLKARISLNRISDTDVSSAVNLETRENAFASVVLLANSIRDTDGEGIKVVAENASQIDVVMSFNWLRDIGDGSGDNAIQINGDTDGASTVKAVVSFNRIDTVQGIGLNVRGLGDSSFDLAIFRNHFTNTNLLSGAAAVLIDDEDPADTTSFQLLLLGNIVDNSNGADAYQLNQQDPGVFNVIGKEATAQEVVENNNKGGPVTINGTINVVPFPHVAWWAHVWYKVRWWY